MEYKQKQKFTLDFSALSPSASAEIAELIAANSEIDSNTKLTTNAILKKGR